MSLLIEKGLKYLEINHPFLAFMIQHHKTHQNKRISLNRRYYLLDLYKDKSNFIVAIKSTQSGFSEFLISRAIYNASLNRNTLYVMPTDLLKSRFVSARFNKTLEFSPYYMQLNKDLNSTSLKQFNDGIINFVGSNAPSSFIEFVAHDIIVDELDRCNQSNMSMAGGRQSSIEDKTTIYVSNPTIQAFGIDYEYNKTDKKDWHIKCECGNYFTPDFFKHVVKKIDDDFVLIDREWTYESDRDIYMICDKCGNPVDRFKNGEWIKQNSRSDRSGYRMSKLFSTVVTVREIIDNFNDGLYSDIKLQHFYNNDLGLAYTSAGAKLDDITINTCIGDFVQLDNSDSRCIMGVDVGEILNVVVGEINGDFLRIIKIAELRDYEDLLDFYRRYNIIIGIIDSRPEIRMSRRVVTNMKNMWMCNYLTENPRDTMDLNRKIISTDRTMSMDGVKEMFLTKKIILPKDIPDNFRLQMKAPTRIWQERENSVNNGRYVWAEGNQADHYFHACNYMLIAKKILVMARG